MSYSNRTYLFLVTLVHMNGVHNTVDAKAVYFTREKKDSISQARIRSSSSSPVHFAGGDLALPPSAGPPEAWALYEIHAIFFILQPEIFIF